LFNILHVPSILRNLFYLSKLDAGGHSFRFGNDYFSFYKRTCMIGSSTIYNGLYKLNLDNVYVETLMTLHHNVDIKHSLVNKCFTYLWLNVWDIFPKKGCKD